MSKKISIIAGKLLSILLVFCEDQAEKYANAKHIRTKRSKVEG